MRTEMKRFAVAALGIGAMAVAFVAPLHGTRATFVPDWTFKGSTLAGWHTIGSAQWTASNGEIVGKPTSPAGGWLVLDKSYQDIEVGADVKCVDGCKTGVLLRAEKTANGMKGVFVSLAEGEQGGFAVTLDAQGNVLTHEPLGRAGGMARYAPNTDPVSAQRAGRAG